MRKVFFCSVLGRSSTLKVRFGLLKNISEMCSRSPQRSVLQEKTSKASSTTSTVNGNSDQSHKCVGKNSNFVGSVEISSKDSVDLGKLSEEEKEIYYRHLEACQNGESMYKDPATGYAVFTEIFHKQRNSCCGNGCRHCPYNHENVPASRRTTKFNSAFYY
ncbi:uncharacterized protein C1orf53 [Exaiptasia diaphana]|uniref:Uncharacterized protein n=1 Tax=Exaiptasia diaphana TaxID=2652724 RepID=A0A913WZ19_EXADI|nr:uncharacterized protein C1orf53 [Exaiptasia diaphana]KXJ16662.1 Uncharacterized protein C1orf53 [Exaiptasia diaphana]